MYTHWHRRENRERLGSRIYVKIFAKKNILWTPCILEKVNLILRSKDNITFQSDLAPVVFHIILRLIFPVGLCCSKQIGNKRKCKAKFNWGISKNIIYHQIAHIRQIVTGALYWPGSERDILTVSQIICTFGSNKL